MKIVTLGEVMLRLSPPANERFVQADTFGACYGGAEANVAVMLAQLGAKTEFVTKLPENELGQAALNSLRRWGVGTEYIVRGDGRLGVYYLERGASQRAGKVIYDRAGSAFAVSSAEEYDESVFEGADWFHFTGITPALSPETAEICIEACKKAKEKGITISADLNFRKKLWTREQANKTMTELCKYIDVCIANEEDAKDVFGIEAENTDIDSGKLNREGYISVAKQLTDRFDFRYVAITLRESISANDNNWSAMLYSGKEKKAYFSRKYAMHIVDRVGGGDSFGGGLIYALRSGYDEQKAIEFAVAASCLKHSVEGDYNMVSVSEVESLAGGSGSGRVQR